jgi:hypothetical protein
MLSEGWKMQSGLEDVMRYFPQLQEDFDMLIGQKVITREIGGGYKWHYSLTSLGEYFKSIEADYSIPGGFWNPIETAFGIKRGTLRHLVSNNGREFKRERSRDFEKIIAMLNPHRKRIATERKTLFMFDKIKELIEGATPQTHEERKKIIEQIKNILD